MATSTRGLKLGKILVASSIIVLVCYFVLQTIAIQKFQDLITEKLPEKFTLEYDNFRLNLFSRSLAMGGILLQKNSQDSLRPNFTLTLDALEAKKIDFAALINKGNVELGVLDIIGLNLQTIQRGADKNNSKEKQNLPKISIKSLQIKEARACYLNQLKSDTLFRLNKGMVSLNNVQFNNEAPQMLTLDTTLVELHADGLKFKLSDYEKLEIASMQVSSGSYILDSLNLKTKYDWKTYSQKLYHERDHYELSIKRLEGFGLKWPFENVNARLISDSLSISKMNCSIFRDKMLPDDTSTKTFFMESLSQLNFPLHLPKIRMSDAKLSYFEKTEKSDSPEPLVFSSIHGDFVNVSNQNNDALKIHFKSKLMENSPLELKLETDVGMPLKSFVCTGKLYDFNANDINPFLCTNMGVRTKGKVQELYFTISGNRQGALGDIKMKYDDFEFEILKKDLLGVRKTTSFILNLLVNRGNKTDEKGYRYGDINVEPKISKSFTNYLWLGVQDGLLDAVTGSGKKS